jgi:hypothetical protein
MMKFSYPVMICALAAIANFSIAVALRNFKVPAHPPASRAGLTVEQRQHKITIARRLLVTGGGVMIVGAALLLRLG